MSAYVFSILEQDWFTFSVECVALAAAYAACLAAVVLVVRLAVGRWLAPRYRHALWLVVAVRLFLPIAPESRFSLHRLWLDRVTERAETVAVPMAEDTAMMLAAADAQPDPSFTVPTTVSTPSRFDSAFYLAANLLVPSWPAGMLITAGWITFATWRCRRRMRGLVATDDQRLLAILEACRLQLAVRRRVELVLVTGLSSPAQMGLVRPKILLPDDVARDFSADELRHIVLHELAHIKRWDVAVNLLLSLLQVVYWWNPVFWFVRSRLVAERELACDALVVRAIGQERAVSYGRTLVHIVERLADAVAVPWNPPASAPGLISFLGRASALKSRLRQLPRSTVGTSRKAHVAAWLLIAALVWTGLTDANSNDVAEFDEPEATDAWFNLPQNATWYVAPPEEADDQPPVTVSYDARAVLDRFEQDERCPRDAARVMISSILTPTNFGDPRGTENQTADKHRRLRCEWQEDLLVCQGQPSLVTSTTNLLNAWCKHGLQQICCEIQHIESPSDALTNLGIVGGEIISAEGNKLEPPEFLTDSVFHKSQTGSAFDVRSATSIERQYPIYLKVLNDAAMRRLRAFVQSDYRVSLKMNPKVTIFQGQQASIQNIVQRPFVVGLRSENGQAPTPQVRIVPQGSRFWLLAIADPQTNRVRMKIGIGDTRIIDVTTATAVAGPDGKPLRVQIPSVENRAYNVTAELSSGESLLLHPLEETAKHRRSYIVITPRIVTPVAE